MKQEISSKSIIVVLGMHRSGTSVTTRGLQVLGVDLGDNLMPPVKANNETGFWEDMDINELNDDLLESMNSAWDRLALLDEERQSHNFVEQKKTAISILETKMKSADLFGFKDPRTAILLPFWKTIFQEIDLDERYIIAVRNPLSVANSLLNRDAIPLEVGILLWVKHMSGVLRYTQGKCRVVVDYDLMLETPSLQIQRIANMLSLPFDELSQQRLNQFEKDFIRLDLRHQSASLEELRCSELVPDIVKDAYALMLKLAKDEIKFDDVELEEIWRRFEDVCRSFNIGYQYMDRQALSFQQLLEEKETIQQQLDHATNELAELREMMEEHSLQYKQMSAENNNIYDEKRSIQDQLDQEVTELTESREMQQQLQLQYQHAIDELDNMQKSYEELHKAHIQSLAEKDIARDQLADILNSHSWKLTGGLRAIRLYLITWPVYIVKKYVYKILHAIWQALPVSHEKKSGIRKTIIRQGGVKGKLKQGLEYFNLVVRSVRDNGVRETFKKIQERLKYQRGNPVYDLIALKPVENKWKPAKKLNHKYNISVVIPTYNRANLLEGLLDSWRRVAEVTRYSYEIIFSDDGSTDETLRILSSAKDLPIRIIKNEHGGASKARNAAILAAEGEKILIIGDDIFPNKYLLNQHYEKLNELDITDAVLGECVWHPDLKINHLMIHITEIGLEQFSFNVFQGHQYTDFRHFYTCNISIDREFLLSEKTIFDESFYKVNYEDIELGYRLARKGMRIYYYPEACGQHLHEYNDVKKFCMRQETAGEMAIVFHQLHKEMDVILQIDLIVSGWRKYLEDNVALVSKYDLYSELINFCQFIEDHYETRDSDLSEYLSAIYTALFRLAYEKGVVQQKSGVNTESLNSVLLHSFLNKKIRDSFSYLNNKCKVPNYEIVTSLLESNPLENISLTIEVEDQRHLDMLMEKYGDYQTCIQYRFKSEAAYNGYVYRPEGGFVLSKNALKEVILFLQNYDQIDIILLSFGLLNLPKVGLANVINNNLIGRGDIVQDGLINLKEFTKGKIIRIFEDVKKKDIDLSALANNKVNYLDEYGFFANKKYHPENAKNNLCRFNLEEPIDNPVVFVFPTFLAVGGAERNTIEIINNLKTKYDFVVVNFERLNEELGSLHYQFISSCKAVYDLTELSSHDDILCYLKALKGTYNPVLVWICNGSPWFAGNTINIRELFSDSAIVDQQVYDEKEGWINIFDDKGIHSFDRYIAINSKIQKEFIDGRGIDDSQIDLIHHVVKSERFNRSLYNQKKNDLAAKYNIPLDKRNYVFVGRMADQKRPFLFLDMIAHLQNDSKEINDANFIMVGDGPYSDKVKEVIDKKSLRAVQRIRYIENVAELYALAEGLIITSKFEGLPIAMLEAMCMGLPVLATNVGDIDIMLEEYKSGILVPVNSSSVELAEKFIEFDKNLKTYQKRAQDCAEEVRKRFSEESVSRNYDLCFQKALDNVKN